MRITPQWNTAQAMAILAIVTAMGDIDEPTPMVSYEFTTISGISAILFESKVNNEIRQFATAYVTGDGYVQVTLIDGSKEAEMDAQEYMDSLSHSALGKVSIIAPKISDDPTKTPCLTEAARLIFNWLNLGLLTPVTD